MTLHELRPKTTRHQAAVATSPVASDRIRALADRVMKGAPTLTAGEMRELADAILEHNKMSETAQP